MKRVLIVRLDAIGDYVLWRNCLRFMRNRGQYSGAHLTVFGNPAWRDLAETFDADCADEWIWAENRNDLFRKSCENLLPYCIWHRRVAVAQAKAKAALRAHGFDEVVSPSAFPDALLDEFVTGIAPVTISVENGDLGRRAKFSRLVSPGEEPFVFLRNKAIASELAGSACDARFSLDVGDAHREAGRILFFDDASHWTKRWSARRWRELEAMLPQGCSAVFAQKGKSLSDFVRLAASCEAVVSNDTMALHVAAALGVPAVAVVNGVSGEGGFWPYPESMGKRVEICMPSKVPSIPIPLIGSRVAPYMALSSVSARQAADALKKAMGIAAGNGKRRD